MIVRAAWILAVVVGSSLAGRGAETDPTKPYFIRSAGSGRWSEPQTWAGGKVPAAGDRVYVAPKHHVVYDVASTAVVRSLHLDGTLEFATDRDTRLEVGLIRVGAGGTTDESGSDCKTSHSATNRPAGELQSTGELRIGSPARPLPAKHTALIRLHYVEGMDKDSCPAIICCGGRMDFHGSPLNRTWVKLGQPAAVGDAEITLDEAVTGWKPGDRIIVVSTQIAPFEALRGKVQDYSSTTTETEERIITAVDGVKLTLDKPLAFPHVAERKYRGAVANLSRNVVVESADPEGVRGHTMYHRDSAGSISYAEFRHLGKAGVLGRYSIHFHLAGDTMRGSSVIGASIWDSHNRWITIHGTNYLVVRDCVGYRSQGHGFFLEDGTEVYGVLDRNLAVQAYTTKPLPKQVLPFDENDGAGFWWANCLNTFTRNVASECGEYGYFFQVQKKADEFDPVLAVRQPDGSSKRVDIRTLPFVRFEDNEAYTQRRWGINLGSTPFHHPVPKGEKFQIGPDDFHGTDPRHPLEVRNMLVWNSVWSFGIAAPNVLIDGLDFYNYHYGFFHPQSKNHCFRNITFEKTVHPTRGQFTDEEQAARRLFQGGKGERADPAGYPKPLDPIDDLPPITVITQVMDQDGKLHVRGTTSDNGKVTKVMVNGAPAKATRPNFAEWEATLDGPPGDGWIKALAEDEAGNRESRAHEVPASRR